MALSSYSNSWASFPQSESGVGDLDYELQYLHDMWNTDNPSLENPNFFVPPDYSNSFLNDLSNADGLPPFDNLLNSHIQTQPISPHQEFHYPKRQKLCISDQLLSSPFDPCLTMLQDYPPPLPDFTAAEFSVGSFKKAEANGGGGESLSAQSMAARQRLRKITAKTQELGKLVPGGKKMNTAEMLQSAYKYIKFLQAQVALLEFVAWPHQEVSEALFEGQEEFQNLLESPLIQEKLSSTENCLLPRKLAEELPFDDEILKSNPQFASVLGKKEPLI